MEWGTLVQDHMPEVRGFFIKKLAGDLCQNLACERPPEHSGDWSRHETDWLTAESYVDSEISINCLELLTKKFLMLVMYKGLIDKGRCLPEIDFRAIQFNYPTREQEGIRLFELASRWSFHEKL